MKWFELKQYHFEANNLSDCMLLLFMISAIKILYTFHYKHNFSPMIFYHQIYKTKFGDLSKYRCLNQTLILLRYFQAILRRVLRCHRKHNSLNSSLSGCGFDIQNIWHFWQLLREMFTQGEPTPSLPFTLQCKTDIFHGKCTFKKGIQNWPWRHIMKKLIHLSTLCGVLTENQTSLAFPSIVFHRNKRNCLNSKPDLQTTSNWKKNRDRWRW